MLRLQAPKTACGLLSSHDDYSATEVLPEHAAILTQLRQVSLQIANTVCTQSTHNRVPKAPQMSPGSKLPVISLVRALKTNFCSSSLLC